MERATKLISLVAIVAIGSETIRLANGLTIAVERDTDADYLALMSVSRVSDFSPQERAALEVASFSIVQETDSFSPEAFRRLTWYVGGRVEAQLVGDTFQIKIATQKTHFGPAISLLSDMLLRGCPSEETVAKGQSDWRNWYLENSKFPLFGAMRKVRLELGLGPAESFDSRYVAVKLALNKALSPKRTVISIVGGVEAQSAATRIQASLGDWIANTQSSVRPISKPAPAIQSPFITSVVSIKGPAPDSKSFPAWFVATQALGSGKGSTLYQTFRIENGTTYLFGVAYTFPQGASWAHFYIPRSAEAQSEPDSTTKTLTNEISSAPSRLSVENIERAKDHFFASRQFGPGSEDGRLAPFSQGRTGLFERAFELAWGELWNCPMDKLEGEVRKVTVSEAIQALKDSIPSLKAMTIGPIKPSSQFAP